MSVNANEMAATVAQSLGQPANHKGTARLAADLNAIAAEQDAQCRAAEGATAARLGCCEGDCTHTQRDEINRETPYSVRYEKGGWGGRVTGPGIDSIALHQVRSEESLATMLNLAYVKGSIGGLDTAIGLVRGK